MYVYEAKHCFLLFGVLFIRLSIVPPHSTEPREITTTRLPKSIFFSADSGWRLDGTATSMQQPDRNPVCQASLATTESSEYSNSTAVGFEPVRRHFFALQTPASSCVASRDRQHDPVQRSANKATCSTERTALVRPRQTVCIASHRVAPIEHFSHRSSAKRHWLRTLRPEPAEPPTLLFCSTVRCAAHAAFLM